MPGDHFFPSSLHFELPAEHFHACEGEFRADGQLSCGCSAVLATADNRDPNACFIRVVGNSMEPVLGDGWLVRADTLRQRPQPGEVVAVEITGEGRYVGYWSSGDIPVLLKANPAASPLELAGKEWRVVGVVTMVVDRPITPRRAAT